MPRGSVADRPSSVPPGSGGANKLLPGPEAGHGSGGRGDWNSPCGCSIRCVSNCVSAGTGAPYMGGGCGACPAGGRLAGGWLPGGGGHGSRESDAGGGGG